MTISDSVLSVAALLRAGDLRAARQQWDVTLGSADDVEIAALLECGRILSAYPRTATAHLRRYWCNEADARVRAVIEACAPHPDQQHRPTSDPQPEQDASRWDRRRIEQARAQRRTSGKVRTEIRPEQLRDRRQQRQAARDLSDRLTYAATHPTTDPEPDDTRTRPETCAVDYERMAVNPVARERGRGEPRRSAVSGNGRPCVALGCHVEPSRTDRQYRDGLCQDCRDAGRPGIHAPADATRTQLVGALCTYIRENYPNPVSHLRREWSRARTNADRTTIAAWVKAHIADTTPDHTTCENCPSVRQIRHGLCLDCRHLDEDDLPSLAAVRTHTTNTAPVESETATVAELVDPLNNWAAEQSATAAA